MVESVNIISDVLPAEASASISNGANAIIKTITD
jgi:hypothetical protein